MANITIKIVQEQHYIDGDIFNAFLEQENKQMIIACNVKPEDYLQMCEKLDGLRIRLQELGNNVWIKIKVNPDPNFESEVDANEYLMTQGA